MLVVRWRADPSKSDVKRFQFYMHTRITDEHDMTSHPLPLVRTARLVHRANAQKVSAHVETNRG